ncbi:hypothetical protein DM01DRAFT_1239732 [Hesseltinella vesiculosa]|uniref:Uncharacterized protein n=1 Tax=Hesseltinella vesiculosa TaxID=101127 RepID=A0A1X2GMF5_9FUNG|nr:hypothetical protein DM01DRAFT_1239732 [Hesseltinella vesiculosa]
MTHDYSPHAAAPPVCRSPKNAINNMAVLSSSPTIKKAVHQQSYQKKQQDILYASPIHHPPVRPQLKTRRKERPPAASGSRLRKTPPTANPLSPTTSAP